MDRSYRRPSVILHHLPCASLFGLCVIALLSGRAVQAQTIRTWDGSASAVWGTEANWSGNNVPNSTSEAALFDSTGSGQPSPSINADVTIGQLQYGANAPSYSIIDGGAFTLSLDPAGSFSGIGITAASGAANQSISADINIISSQTWNIDGTTSLTVSGVINDDGTDALTKTGTGTLILSGNNSYHGTTTISAGSLVVSGNNASMDGNWTLNGGTLRGTTSANAFGDNAGGNTLTLAGGTLELANDTGLNFGRNTTVTGDTVINSDRLTAGAGVTHTLGTLGIGAQTLTVDAGANVSSGTAGVTFGNATLTGSPMFNAEAGSQLNLAGIASGSGSDRTISFSGNGNITVSGVIDDAAGGGGITTALTKSGSGTLTLSGANTYIDTTTISAGTLSAGDITVTGGSSNLGNATSPVILGSSTTTGTLSYTGGADVYTRGFSVTAGNGGGALINTTGNLLQMSTGDTAVGNGATMTFGASGTGGITLNASSIITGLGNVAVNSTGSGVVTFSGNNTFSGTTSITDGTLNLDAAGTLASTSAVSVAADGNLTLSGASNLDRVNNAAPINLAGGSITKGAGASEGSATAVGLGALTLSASSTIDFGTGGVGVLAFNGYSPGGFTLSILNWTGVPKTLGTASTDRLIFAGSQSANLSAFQFDGYGPGAMQLSLGGGLYEIVPVPEPGAVLAVVLLVLPVAWRERRWFMRVRHAA